MYVLYGGWVRVRVRVCECACVCWRITEKLRTDTAQRVRGGGEGAVTRVCACGPRKGGHRGYGSAEEMRNGRAEHNGTKLWFVIKIRYSGSVCTYTRGKINGRTVHKYAYCKYAAAVHILCSIIIILLLCRCNYCETKENGILFLSVFCLVFFWKTIQQRSRPRKRCGWNRLRFARLYHNIIIAVYGCVPIMESCAHFLEPCTVTLLDFIIYAVVWFVNLSDTSDFTHVAFTRLTGWNYLSKCYTRLKKYSKNCKHK